LSYDRWGHSSLVTETGDGDRNLRGQRQAGAAACRLPGCRAHPNGV